MLSVDKGAPTMLLIAHKTRELSHFPLSHENAVAERQLDANNVCVSTPGVFQIRNNSKTMPQINLIPENEERNPPYLSCVL